MTKPFSQACENNKGPILEILQKHLQGAEHILEIGSGTGQHAVFFAEQFPDVRWQCGDLGDYHQGIKAWINDSGLDNVMAPIEIDVDKSQPQQRYDSIFSANTLHIMGWQSVEKFFPFVAGSLTTGGLLFIYGPFNYNGAYTSESNARFDQWLQSQNSYSGLRDFEEVERLASASQLSLIEDNAMPANNRTLIFKRQ